MEKENSSARYLGGRIYEEEKQMTQCEKIVDYIKRFGSITTMEAFTDLGITRLASRIHDLVSEGVEIEKTVETGRNRFGEPVHYMRYSIKEEQKIEQL